MPLRDAPRTEIAPRPAKVEGGEREEPDTDRRGHARAREQRARFGPQGKRRVRRSPPKPVAANHPGEFLHVSAAAREEVARAVEIEMTIERQSVDHADAGRDQHRAEDDRSTV